MIAFLNKLGTDTKLQIKASIQRALLRILGFYVKAYKVAAEEVP